MELYALLYLYSLPPQPDIQKKKQKQKKKTKHFAHVVVPSQKLINKKLCTCNKTHNPPTYMVKKKVLLKGSGHFCCNCENKSFIIVSGSYTING